ncbi:hypothetical protein BDZ89DRAFT_1164349 [Hymenopellis radicata]|nr:hypothetical protein BDZ89DRAFT_1164349 [Hymenopellis radicata]
MAITLAAILSIRYAPTAAIALLFFDHLLTLDQEVDAIWSRRCSRYTTRGMYILHRYFTEGVLLYTVYMFGGYTKRITDLEWVSLLVGTACGNLWVRVTVADVSSGFVTTIRLYKSWDNQIRIRYILIGAFSISYVAAVVLSIISVTFLVRAEHIIHPGPILGDQCSTGNIPRTVPWLLGILLAFDVFVIALSLYRALEMPRRSHAELLHSLHLDGARLHLAVSGEIHSIRSSRTVVLIKLVSSMADTFAKQRVCAALHLLRALMSILVTQCMCWVSFTASA